MMLIVYQRSFECPPAGVHHQRRETPLRKTSIVM
jgi:hypothetical protein